MVGVEESRIEGVIDQTRNGPREEVGEMGGDEGDVGRGGAVGSVASRRILVEDREIAAFDGADQRFAARITKSRIPPDVMSVEVAQDDGIARQVVEQRIKVRPIAWRARLGWREVDVVNGEALMTKMYVDRL